MKPELALAHRLAAEIESELEALAALGEEFADTPRGNEVHSVRARGSILHDFYNGVERVLLRIARELNGGVPRGEQWHRDLIGDMALTIPGLRSAVIDDDLAVVLGEYLRFRHVFPKCLRRAFGRATHGFVGDTPAGDDGGISAPDRGFRLLDAWAGLRRVSV